MELEADILLKATRVDGVFSDDPEKNPHAVLYSELSYDDVPRQNLRVMDPTAIAKCMEYDMPILVFNFRKEGNIEQAVIGDRIGTLIPARCRDEVATRATARSCDERQRDRQRRSCRY